MQTEVLQEFLVVADYLNFTKAAEELHITQPGLSKHIAALERELGFKLFDRTGQTKLTPEGKHFYVCAQRTLNTLENGIKECKALAQKAAPVKIQWSGQESQLFGDMIRSLKTPFELIKADTCDSLLTLLEEGEVDSVLAYNVDQIPSLSEEIEQGCLASTPLGEEKVVLMMSASNPIASKESIQVSDLDNAETVVAQGKLFDIVVRSVQSLVDDKLNMKIIRDPTGFRVQDLLYRDLDQDIYFVSEKTAEDVKAHRPDVVTFDEIDRHPLAYVTSLVYRANDPNPNVQAFVEEVQALAEGVQTTKDGKEKPQ